MAKVCHALAQAKSSERIGEARTLQYPSCADVSGSVAEAMPCPSCADVSEGKAKALPCQSCADVSENESKALPCQSDALSSKQARRPQLKRLNYDFLNLPWEVEKVEYHSDEAVRN